MPDANIALVTDYTRKVFPCATQLDLVTTPEEALRVLSAALEVPGTASMQTFERLSEALLEAVDAVEIGYTLGAEIWSLRTGKLLWTISRGSGGQVQVARAA